MDDKVLVVWYSRTGVTAQVAGDIVAALQCQGEEIVDRKKRVGGWGFFKSCFHAIFRMGSKIAEPKFNPVDFNLVVVCSPVWAGTMACTVRQWMKVNEGKFPEVAFVATAGSQKTKTTFKHMAALAGREPAATLSLIDTAVKAGEYDEKLQEFTDKLRETAAGEKTESPGEEPPAEPEPPQNKEESDKDKLDEAGADA